MLSLEARNKMPAKAVHRHFWTNDSEIAKKCRLLLIYWIRSSTIFWILTLLLVLTYLGSAVVKIISI
jgi:hypothetical protein